MHSLPLHMTKFSVKFNLNFGGGDIGCAIFFQLEGKLLQWKVGGDIEKWVKD